MVQAPACAVISIVVGPAGWLLACGLDTGQLEVLITSDPIHVIGNVEPVEVFSMLSTQGLI